MKSLVSQIRRFRDKLTVALISETDQLSKKYQNITKQLEDKLTGDKSEENLRQVHNLQYSLSDLAVYAYTIPNFFTEQRIKDGYGLLKRTEEYLQATEYEERPLRIAREFFVTVAHNKRAVEATERLKAEALKLERVA